MVKVGLIGAGAMGATHARTLETAVRGAELVAVSDIDTARAAAVAATGRLHEDSQALIADPDVDAVLIALPFTTEQAITDSVVHEVDVVRWLLAQEITAVSALAGRASRHAPDGVRDPQVVLLETSEGVLVDVESLLRAQYGYDIRCEVVGEDGALELPPPAMPAIRSDGCHSRAVPPGFEVRFARAYRDELQAWVDSMRLGRASGPTAWDGYAAGAVTEARLHALASGERVAVTLMAAPGAPAHPGS